jgi:hypothetical protein
MSDLSHVAPDWTARSNAACDRYVRQVGDLFHGLERLYQAVEATRQPLSGELADAMTEARLILDEIGVARTDR